MSRLLQRIHVRAQHGPHSRTHIERQRRTALILIVTALVRVAAWTLLTVFYLVGVVFAVKLFESVAFVALISMFALILTDWGQFAASMAQLTAGDAHADTARLRVAQQVDFVALESNIARLAGLQPGPEAVALADEIRAQISNEQTVPS